MLTPAKMRILEEYLKLHNTHAGVNLVRAICTRLYYNLDQNKTNSFVSRQIAVFDSVPEETLRDMFNK
jgi:hypothetical protein